MAEVQKNSEESGWSVRPIDWQSSQVWVTSLIVALALGAFGGVACALADPLLAYRAPFGAEIVAGIWSLVATLAAFGSAFWMARHWSVKYGGPGDPATTIITGGGEATSGRASYFMMMGLWVLAVFAVGSMVLAVSDLFLAITSSPGSRALALGGFGIIGVPLLFWTLGEQAQVRKPG